MQESPCGNRMPGWVMGLVLAGAVVGCRDDTGEIPPDGAAGWDGSVPLVTGCQPAAELADTSRVDQVVGDGTPDSCTEGALAEAVARGGVVVFDCGPDPVTIRITQPIQVQRDVVLDGGGLVTLDGGGQNRVFEIRSSFERASPTLWVQRLTFLGGRSPAQGDDTEQGGGAIWSLGGNITAVDCTFQDNHAPETGQDVAGGAIYNVGRGRIDLESCVFVGNSASNGGALGGLHVDMAMTNSVFVSNEATGNGGNPGNGGCGGAVYVDGTGQTVKLCGVVLRDNVAGEVGGGIFRVSNDGQGAMLVAWSTVLHNVTRAGSSGVGGGLFLLGMPIRILNTTVARNESDGPGGGLFVGNGASFEMVNSTVAENVSWNGLAGGIFFTDDVPGGSITNCTFARNRAPCDVCFAAATRGGSPIRVSNTIFEGNEAGNGWNPITCQHTFQEGGGNFQWPVERSGGGSDDPDALCTPHITIQDVGLGDLKDNGGPTPTAMPDPNGPAVGAGHDCPETDQRGRRRPEPCTAGAVEVRPTS